MWVGKTGKAATGWWDDITQTIGTITRLNESATLEGFLLPEVEGMQLKKARPKGPFTVTVDISLLIQSILIFPLPLPPIISTLIC